MQTAQSKLLAALSTLTAREDRPEALQTAAAVGAGRLDDVRPPCALGAEILALARQPDAMPEAALLTAAQRFVPWGISPASARQPGRLADIKAVATLVGPGAPIPSQTVLFGLFYQAAGTYYPLHSHAADETYTILAGQALWRAGDNRRWRGAGEAVHHPSHMPHAFLAGPQGFLAMWRWSGDIGFDSYRILNDPEDPDN